MQSSQRKRVESAPGPRNYCGLLRSAPGSHPPGGSEYQILFLNTVCSYHSLIPPRRLFWGDQWEQSKTPTRAPELGVVTRRLESQGFENVCQVGNS
jgi:hypothetical protein